MNYLESPSSRLELNCSCAAHLLRERRRTRHWPGDRAKGHWGADATYIFHNLVSKMAKYSQWGRKSYVCQLVSFVSQGMLLVAVPALSWHGEVQI